MAFEGPTARKYQQFLFLLGLILAAHQRHMKLPGGTETTGREIMEFFNGRL